MIRIPDTVEERREWLLAWESIYMPDGARLHPDSTDEALGVMERLAELDVLDVAEARASLESKLVTLEGPDRDMTWSIGTGIIQREMKHRGMAGDVGMHPFPWLESAQRESWKAAA